RRGHRTAAHGPGEARGRACRARSLVAGAAGGARPRPLSRAPLCRDRHRPGDFRRGGEDSDLPRGRDSEIAFCRRRSHMECRELTEHAIDRLTGQISQPRRAELEAHLETCAGCRAELARIEDSWQALGADRDAEMTEDFRLGTLALLEDEMTRGRIRAFRPRP